jgi:hypothetical protein
MENEQEDRALTEVEKIEARRAERKKAIAKSRAEQYEKDLERVDALEQEHGDDRVAVLKMPSFVAGLPTVVVVKTPSAPVFRRFRDMVRKSKQNPDSIGAAQELLATSCIAYPDAETYKRMQEQWPSIHDNAGLEAIRLGEAEGKG